MPRQDQRSFPAVFAADNGAILFLDAGGGMERIILHGGEVINFDSPVSDVVTIREIAEDVAGGAALDRGEGVDFDQVMGECDDIIEAAEQRLRDAVVIGVRDAQEGRFAEGGIDDILAEVLAEADTGEGSQPDLLDVLERLGFQRLDEMQVLISDPTMLTDAGELALVTMPGESEADYRRRLEIWKAVASMGMARCFRPVEPDLLRRINDLVDGVEINLDEPLPPDDTSDDQDVP